MSRWFIPLFVIGSLAMWTSAQEPPPRDNVDIAAEALSFGRWEKAIRHMREFLDSSAGDPRISETKKQLNRAYRAWIEQLTREQREDDAARAAIAMRDCPHLSDSAGAEELVKKTREAIVASIDRAIKRKDAARALQLNAAYVELFASDTPPLSATKCDELTMQVLTSVLADRAAVEFLPELIARFASESAKWDQVKGQKPDKLVEAYYRAMLDRGWFGKLIYEAKQNRWPSNIADMPAIVDLLERAYLSRVQAWMSMGSVAGVKQSMVDAKEAVKSKAGLSRLNLVENQIKRANVPDLGPFELKFDQPLANGVWDDPAGRGLLLEGKATIGEDRQAAELVIAPGVIITGGEIDVKRGRLIARAVPGRPIIFRKVKIGVSYVGHFEAEGVIFEDCTFYKSGGTYWVGGFSSKWQLAHCLIYRCKFNSLDQTNFGLKLDDVAFVECDLPGRILKGPDLARDYQHEWNHWAASEFVACDVPPSIAWIAMGSSYIACTVKGRDEFTSATDVAARGMALWPAEFSRNLLGATICTSRGDVAYVLTPRPAGNVHARGLWAYLPIYEPKQEKSEN